jgi:hypothetical protein
VLGRAALDRETLPGGWTERDMPPHIDLWVGQLPVPHRVLELAALDRLGRGPFEHIPV